MEAVTVMSEPRRVQGPTQVKRGHCFSLCSWLGRDGWVGSGEHALECCWGGRLPSLPPRDLCGVIKARTKNCHPCETHGLKPSPSCGAATYNTYTHTQ